jgi:hypothetical protein
MYFTNLLILIRILWLVICLKFVFIEMTLLDKLITHIVYWYKTFVFGLATATRSDTGSQNRLDLIQSFVPTHYVCNGYVSYFTCLFFFF